MVVIHSHVSGNRRTWSLPRTASTTLDVLAALVDREGDAPGILLQSEGRVLEADDVVMEDMTVVATLALNGGKGGFGSMLRAIGAQIQKTTNHEACRDLNGRRLRDVNEEKRILDYISKKAAREQEAKDRKRKRLAKLDERPKHVFEDRGYMQQKEKIEQNLYDALEKGKRAENKAGSSGSKSLVTSKGNIKRAKLMGLGDLDDTSSEEESDEDENIKMDNSEMSSILFPRELVVVSNTSTKRYRPTNIALRQTRPFKSNVMLKNQK